MTIENFQIQSIGLQYLGHFNVCSLRLFADSFGVTIPLKRVGEFVKLFPDVDWENGYMLHNLCGRYLRVMVSKEGRVIGFKHIVDDIEFILTEDKAQ